MPVKRNGWPPRWLTRTTPTERGRGDGELVANFIEEFCVITKDTVAGNTGTPIELRVWQRELLAALFARRANGRRKHRQALIGMARKNGKSALGSGIALFGLLLEVDGAEVYSCAADRDQARIVFGMAKRMVELKPELAERIKPYRDALEVPSTGSIYRCLSAEAYTKEGLSPTLVVFDEVHAQPNRELWDVMNLGSGARRDPLALGITTAGVMTDTSGRESLCYGLYRHGQQVAQRLIEDPAFFMAWWEPKAGVEADHRDPKVWAEANPGYGDIIDAEDFGATLPRTPENEFRIKRTNVFVTGETAWLPYGAWNACVDPTPIADRMEVVLGFDGSYNGDSTALVAVTVADKPHVDVVKCWERPSQAPDGWVVPIASVEDEIRAACQRWKVREIVCDPYRWARTMQVLEAEGLPVVEFPQSPARMVPASQRFYEAVLNHELSQSGDRDLARHVGNVVLKIDARGGRITKETKGSPRKIDLALAAVMAFDHAASHADVDLVDNVW